MTGRTEGKQRRPVFIFSSVSGGVFCETLAAEFTRRGREVSVVSSLALGEYWRAKRVEPWRLRWTMYVTYPLRAFWMALKTKEALLIVTTNPFFLPALLAVVGRLRGNRVVHWLYDLYPEALEVAGVVSSTSLTARFLRLVARGNLRLTAATVFLGGFIERYVAGRYGAPKLARVIPLGPAAEVSTTQQEPAASETDPVHIVYSGHLGAMHAVGALVDGFNAASVDSGAGPEAERECKLTICADGSGFERLKAALARLGVAVNVERVLRLGGIRVRLRICGTLPAEEWKALMAGCQVALVLVGEGAERVVFPSKTFSALAFGHALAVIAPNPSDLQEVVEERRCGWFQELGGRGVGSAEILSALIGQVLESGPEGLRRAQKGARAAAAELCDMRKIGDQWAELADQFEGGPSK